MRDESKFKGAIALAFFAIGLAACRGTVPPAPAEAPSPPRPVPASAKTLPRFAAFDHQREEHRRLQCAQCHRRDEREPAQALPARPYHDACVSCHAREDFLATAAPAPFCRACHGTEAVMDAAEKPVLAAFPTRLRQFGLAAFSHRKHLDPGRGPAPKCDVCHRFEDGREGASFPRHAECYSCHAHTAGQKQADCGVCHAPPATAMTYERGPAAAAARYNFRHASHFKQARIRFDCALCHQPLAPAEAAQSDIARIRTGPGQRHQSACWKCHVQAREPVCTKCHAQGVPAAGRS